MIQVSDLYILIVLDETYTPILVRPLNEWEIPGLGHFEVGNCAQKYRATFKGLNESWDLKLLHDENMFPMCTIPFLLWLIRYRKSGIFRFWEHHQGAQRSWKPHYFLFSCVQLINYLYLQLKCVAQRGHTLFKGSKTAQK